jgi:nitrate/nitrite transporter NarK
VPYTFAVAVFGGRNWTIVSALMLLIPTVLIGIAGTRRRDPAAGGDDRRRQGRQLRRR